MTLVNGIKIVNTRMFVLDRFGAAGWAKLAASLGEDARARIDAVDPVGWYDLALSEQLNHQLWALFDDDSYRLMREIGRFEADRELSTMHRWVAPLVTPLEAIHNLNVYWRRSNVTGCWATRVEGDEVVAALSEWDSRDEAACYRVLGYLSRTLQVLGGQVASSDHPECRLRGAAQCVFRARVTFAQAARPSYRVTIGDVPAIGRELAQCVGAEALAQGVLTLFRVHLGYQRVALWLTREGGDRSAGSAASERGEQLLCAAGPGRPVETRRYLLERSGRVVGRLELGAPRVEPGNSDEQVLHELLPLLAVPLDQLMTPAPVSGGQAAAGGLTERLERSRQRWRLTPRQCEVLALLVHGRTNGEIAEVLECRAGTVELHVGSLLAKCGAENRAMLTALFWRDS